MVITVVDYVKKLSMRVKQRHKFVGYCRSFHCARSTRFSHIFLMIFAASSHKKLLSHLVILKMMRQLISLIRNHHWFTANKPSRIAFVHYFISVINKKSSYQLPQFISLEWWVGIALYQKIQFPMINFFNYILCYFTFIWTF